MLLHDLAFLLMVETPTVAISEMLDEVFLTSTIRP
jgi:hypothetical protein